MPSLSELAPVTIITILSLIVYTAVTFNVGRNRRKYSIKVPATSGPDGFERALRTQQNTLEHLMIFLPALWLFALYASMQWATILGSLWIASRISYAICYIKNISQIRAISFAISLLASVILLIGPLWTIINQMIIR